MHFLSVWFCWLNKKNPKVFRQGLSHPSSGKKTKQKKWKGTLSVYILSCCIPSAADWSLKLWSLLICCEYSGFILLSVLSNPIRSQLIAFSFCSFSSPVTEFGHRSMCWETRTAQVSAALTSLFLFSYLLLLTTIYAISSISSLDHTDFSSNWWLFFFIFSLLHANTILHNPPLLLIMLFSILIICPFGCRNGYFFAFFSIDKNDFLVAYYAKSQYLLSAMPTFIFTLQLWAYH